jgi:polyhydroxybutyrate depolymerase
MELNDIASKIKLRTEMSKRKFRSLIRPGSSVFTKIFAGLNLIAMPVTGGTEKRATLFHQGLERSYHVYFPPSYNNTASVPLVIALHGRGGNGESMILLTRGGFNKLADEYNFLVVYPDGIDRGWNDGRMKDEDTDRPHRENIDDVGFISALIDTMITEFNADPKRVYVTGISNGAILSYRLACELSEKIAAIAPVDGSIAQRYVSLCSPGQPVSVLAINNVNDPLVPFEGGEIVSRLPKARLGVVISVEESIDFWVRNNNCSPVPVVVEEPDRDPSDGTTAKRKEYYNHENGAEVILWSIDGGGHTWPGGVQYLPVWIIGKTSREIDASQVIWEFFKRHTR